MALMKRGSTSVPRVTADTSGPPYLDMTETLYKAGDAEPPASVIVLEETNPGASDDSVYLVRADSGWAWSSDPTKSTLSANSFAHAIQDASSPLRVHTDTTVPEPLYTAADVQRAKERASDKTLFAGGGTRDTSTDKPRFDLLFPRKQPYHLQLLTRFADWMRRGAEKYASRNWEEFSDQAALDHAYASLGRHFAKYMAGETDEDHAAAILFNVACIEYVRQRLDGQF